MKHESKVKRAIKRMGTSYLCHPDNQIKRLSVPLSDTDIRRTFNRLEPVPNNVSRIVRAR